MLKANFSCCPLCPHTTPFPEESSIIGVIYGVLLWADMNTATPLGAWGRSVIAVDAAAAAVTRRLHGVDNQRLHSADNQRRHGGAKQRGHSVAKV